MSRNAEVSFAWADGTHRFRLAWGELAELQEKTGCGPQFLLTRLVSGEWKAGDIYETMRLGLIGGGMAPIEALKLADRYVKDRPLMESLTPAKAVLMAVLMGVEGEGEPGKNAPGEGQSESFPTDASTSPGSTDRPQ